ncbi:MAG: tetratricopeptide repeat protein, partial [Acidobacteria bacterium]|nr:tetratricopeptide repeat protein [Acidobacteriota bacterium]
MRAFIALCCIVVFCLATELSSAIPNAGQQDTSVTPSPNTTPLPTPPASAAPAAASGFIANATAKVEWQNLSPIGRGIALYRRGKFAEAAEAFREARKDDAKSPIIAAWLARCLLKQESIHDAFEIAQQAAADSNDSPAAHTALGDVLFRKGRIADAEAQYIQSLKLMSTDARALLGLSRIYESISLYGKSRLALIKAHELNPNDPEILRDWLIT